jgi:pimeloyl-ACP methyl ester carboxylesterase
MAAVTANPSFESDTTIRTTAMVIRDVFEARRPGYDAFLKGELEVRGNLSLALELESMFAHATPSTDGWPRTIHVMAGRLRWSVLAAGPLDAPPLLLLHGLGATKASFLPTLADLSRDFRVYACDLLGFGDSAKPVASYDAPWFAARVRDLLDALGIGTAGLIGNSMGGRIAIETALRHPDRVRGIVLLCPALAFLRFRQFVPVVRFLRPELSLVPVRPRRSTVLTTMRGIMAHPEKIPASWFEAGVDEFFRVYAKPRGRMAFYAAARNIYLDEPNGQTGFWTRLATLRVPAHFVFGRLDPLIPAGFAPRVADAVPKAGVEVFEDCGHVPQFEQPERTNDLARALLSG